MFKSLRFLIRSYFVGELTAYYKVHMLDRKHKWKGGDDPHSYKRMYNVKSGRLVDCNIN